MQRAVNNLVSQIVDSGIRHVVICPGSRNAPLTLAFTRHPQSICHALIDERSAAYTALGMAMGLKQTVVLLCTSGTAVLNLYPAICEAFYSQIPLLVITADRPAHLIDQWDGQCIRQTNVFANHILSSYTFDPLSSELDFAKIIQQCAYPMQGPVHVNVPLDEPLYAHKHEPFEYLENKPSDAEDSLSVRSTLVKNASDFLQLQPNVLTQYKKILIFAGAGFAGPELKQSFTKLYETGKAVVLADVISGLHLHQTTHHWDAMLTLATQEQLNELKPDLLITLGKFTISKGFKNFIKANKPLAHWHLTHNHSIANPFQTNPLEIEVLPEHFLNSLQNALNPLNSEYVSKWSEVSNLTSLPMNKLLNEERYNEFTALASLLKKIPEDMVLHVGNSMTIRYVSFLANLTRNEQIFANRGTSGIDGCNSTAAGFSMVTEKMVLLITGDLSFLYDINGLWNPYLKPNFKIVVMNNGGGGIFRLLEGPSDLPERESFFATRSSRNAESMALEFGFDYRKAETFEDLEKGLNSLLSNSESPGILEVFTDSESNINFYSDFKKLKIDGES